MEQLNNLIVVPYLGPFLIIIGPLVILNIEYILVYNDNIFNQLNGFCLHSA